MTTPEALKRRQILQNRILMIEGFVILCVGAFLIWATLHFDAEDNAQRACIAHNTSEQNDVLRVRGQLTELETKINKRDANAVGRWQEVTQNLFIRAGDLQDDPDQVLALYEHTKRVWERVDERRARIAEDRAAIKQEREGHPIPDFPEGTCDS